MTTPLAVNIIIIIIIIIINNNYIDRRIYLNLLKSIQSAGLKALKSAGNGRYANYYPTIYIKN